MTPLRLPLDSTHGLTTLDERGTLSVQERGAESVRLSAEIGGPRVSKRGAESVRPRRTEEYKKYEDQLGGTISVSSEGHLARDLATTTTRGSTR
jgi:hypothetical protein